MSDSVFPIKKPDPIYVVDIDIEFAIGYIANLNESDSLNQSDEIDHSIWIDLNDHVNYKKYLKNLKINHRNIFFQVKLNHNTVFNINLETAPESQQLNYKFKFLKDSAVNLLEFDISGFDNEQHMLLLPNALGARPAIKIQKINFDHVDAMQIFSEFSEFKFDNNKTVGNYIFTCNGVSTFEFETPIYRWLLAHRQLLNK